MHSGSINRKVAGVIPLYGENSVVLVSNSKGNLIFPKGGVKRKEKYEEACKREAREEGGIEGEISSDKTFKKKGIVFYILLVTNLLEDYDEKDRRERVILKINDVHSNNRIPKYVKELVKEL